MARENFRVPRRTCACPPRNGNARARACSSAESDLMVGSDFAVVQVELRPTRDAVPQAQGRAWPDRAAIGPDLGRTMHWRTTK